MSNPRVLSGVDALLAGHGPNLKGERLGLILHPASVTADLMFSADALVQADFSLEVLFGPQHGARGEKQDNMIESDHYRDPVSGVRVHSLYSDVRKPTADMLDGLDVVLFDLQDVGVRVYTYVWTMALAMEACAEAGVRFIVLDRPNPIGGLVKEGPVLRKGYESFVGLHPIPLRHGLTSGELARWLVRVRGIDVDLAVVPCVGWRRWMHWDDTGLSWVMPSPNLPTLSSCDVYPGMVLFEGTLLSEGRGTTRPFEFVGAPWIDPRSLHKTVGHGLGDGVVLRPCYFEPTFQKYMSQVCGGGQLHVTDRNTLRSVRAAVALFSACRAIGGTPFPWRPPPYEYEETLMPIDMLWGHDGLRTGIDAGATPDEILEGVELELTKFTAEVEPDLLYE